MDTHHHHEELVAGFYNEQKAVFENSPQAVYAYLDDSHKVCNQKLADMMGYSSVGEWAKSDENFLDVFVAKKSQELLAKTYQNAIEKMVGATIQVTFKTKDGKEVPTTVILVPVMHLGHPFAMHFISK